MVFAPTDKAFKKFAANKPDYFKYYNDHPELVKLLLTNHVIPKILKIDDLKNNELLEPLSKQYLRSNIYGTASSKVIFNTTKPDSILIYILRIQTIVTKILL